jgi:DNA repair protein SbcD/Mre11
VKFIHAADIHLDSPLRGLERYEGAPVAELRGATRRALERLVELCCEERADFLLIAGDLYDGDWPDYNTGLFFTRQMTALRDAGIPVFLIRGNHDAESRITRQLRLPENVRAFSTQEAETIHLPDLGVAIHGRSFPTQAVTENLSLSYPARAEGCFNIGLLHTSAGCPGHDNYAPCSAADLAAKAYDYWALGHVHQRRELRAGEPWIVFPGNLQGRHVREPGVKGCTVVNVDARGDTTLTHAPLDVVRWSLCEIDAAGTTSSDDLVARVREALESELRTADECLLAARISIRGATGAHRALATRPDAFIAELRAQAVELGRVWIERVELGTRALLDLDAIAQGCDPLGQLLQFTRGLREDDAALAGLAGEFAELKRKLPPDLASELFREETALVRALLGDVEQLLVPRLLEEAPATP